MKEQSEKAVKKGSRSYFYAVLGCIAVLLAAAIVITAVALSGREDDIAGIPDPGEIVTPGGAYRTGQARRTRARCKTGRILRARGGYEFVEPVRILLQ